MQIKTMKGKGKEKRKMKKQIKYNIISFVLCISMLFANITPLTLNIVYGENTTIDSIGSINQEDDGVNVGVDKTQTQQTTYDENTEEGLHNTNVFVSQSSTFGVTIPKRIILAGEQNENGLNIGEYQIAIDLNSNINGLETIDVVPDNTVKLSQNGKKDIQANIFQDKVSWRYNELDTKGNGKISVVLSAGMWSGSFNFNIRLSSGTKINVIATDINGENLHATAYNIEGNQKIELLNALETTNIINDKNDVDALIEVESNEFDGIAHTEFDVNSIAQTGDTVVILHFDETKQEWEYIGKDIVDENGMVQGDFTSYSPVAFVVIKEDGSKEVLEEHTHIYKTSTVSNPTCTTTGLQQQVCMICNNTISTTLDALGHSLTNGTCSRCSLTVAGLYDMNDKLVKSWNDLIKEGTITVSSDGALSTTNAATKISNKLVLDKSVKSINDYAFNKCTNLKEVIFPSGLTKMGYGSFQNCSNLKEIIIPNTVKSINGGCFSGCTSLTKVTMPISMSMGNGVFKNDTLIKEVVLTKGTGTGYNIGSSPENIKTPWQVGTIETITIESGVKSIGNNYFYNGNIKSINIPNTVTSIGEYAFRGTKITSIGNVGNNCAVEIPTSVTTIGKGCFAACTSLTKVIYPTHLTSVTDSLFSGCTKLSSATLHNNITTIYDYAFSKCSAIKNITLSSKLTSMGYSSFANCTGLTSITIPNSVKSINGGCFSGCTSLTKVTMPISMSMGNGVFRDDTLIKEVVLTKGTGAGYNIGSSPENIKTPWQVGTIETITIPDGITSIGNNYFYGGNIKEIIVPTNVTKIGTNAFYNVTHVTYSGTATGSPWGAKSIN